MEALKPILIVQNKSMAAMSVHRTVFSQYIKTHTVIYCKLS